MKLNKAPGLWMQDSPVPKIGPNDVLIRVKKTAICGTDVHIYNWDEWAQRVIPVPMIVGHEFVGEIAEVGAEVKGIKVGDRVSGEGHIACEECRSCKAGRRHLCSKNVGVGVTRQGCFAEYLAIPAANAYLIPSQISDDYASILDPLGNAAHVALSFDLVGEDVLITGAGPIGLMSAVIARHVGARNVVITDVNEYRLSIARKMGFDHAINTTEQSVEAIAKDLSIDKKGFDIGFEMSGNSNAFNSMLFNMGHAGKIALLGFLPQSTTIDWNQIILKGLLVKGIYGREMFETWYKMIALLQNGLNLDDIITHRFSVNDFVKGFEVMCSGRSGKVILDWTTN